MPEIIQLKTTNPVVNFKSPNHIGLHTKAVMYNNASKLRISSIAYEESPRHLTASITEGSLPNGTMLKLSAQNPNENFNGDAGQSGNEIILNGTAKRIVSEIGTCYSGKGINDGYNLEYIYEIHAAKMRKTNQNTVTVTLTLCSEI